MEGEEGLHMNYTDSRRINVSFGVNAICS
jgi:hypothetical protein